MQNEATGYKAAAMKVFNDLMAYAGEYSYFQSTDYWKNGNVADTMIDYLLMAVNETDPNYRMPAGLAQDYANAICTHYYDTLHNDAGCWYDDFGWWGITGAKAYDPAYANVFGPYANEFKKIAIDNWNKMQNGRGKGLNYGAPFVWEKCDQRMFSTVAPKYPGGVWQYDIFACPIAGDCSPNNPATPLKVFCLADKGTYDPVDLGPYQLSVVNGLYLVLATRLAKAGVIGTGYANNEFAFINSWCNVETSAESSLLNRYGSADYGLIRERVGYYADGSKSYLYHEGQNAWAGDQGLFIGGLLDYAIAARMPAALTLALKIAKGVPKQMQQMATTDGQLIIAGFVPYNTPLSPFTLDPGDYGSGLGVFMRYLYYAYGRDSQMKQLVNGADYRDAIIKAANAARDNKIPPADVPIFAAFNRLATLMMGIAQNG